MMKGLLLFTLLLVAGWLPCFAQQYQGDITASKDTLTFLVKPRENLSSRLSNVEFFLRWRKEDNDSVLFKEVITNQTSFPGLVIHQGHNDVDDSGYYNHHFAFTGSLLPKHYHVANRNYIVFRVVVEGRIPPSLQLVANNATGVPYYFTVLGESIDHTPYLPTIPLVNKSGSMGAFFYKNLYNDRELDLLAFSSTAEECRPRLAWESKGLPYGKLFEVQQSLDNRNFINVTTLPVKDSTLGANKYEVLLPKVNTAMYYRIRIANQDSSVSWSKPFYYSNDTCRDNDHLSLIRLSSPVMDQEVNVTIKSSRKQLVKLRVVDLNGHTIKYHDQEVLSGETNFNIKLPFLARGVYFLQAQGRTTAKGKKFIVL